MRFFNNYNALNMAYQKVEQFEGKITSGLIENYRESLSLLGEDPEREGLLKPSRSDGNTRLYTEDDLERLEVILKLTRELGVNLAGVEIILNMREKMEEMQRQMQDFVNYVGKEIMSRAYNVPADPEKGAIIPIRHRTPPAAPTIIPPKDKKR